jgi:subtilisin family serine protease
MRRILLSHSVCALCLLVAAMPAQHAATSPTLAPLLPGRPDHGLPGARPGTERWLVQFATRSFDLDGLRAAILARQPAPVVATLVADLEQRMRQDQAGFVTAVQGLGGSVVRQYWLVNAAAVEIPPARLAELRALPNLLRVQPDERCAPVIATATNMNNHRADALQAAGHLGAGVTVAVIDTGQDANMAGTGRPHRLYYPGGDPANATGGGLNGSRLLANRQIGALPPDDVHGHGTGVASICAGAGWSNAAADAGHAPAAGIVGYSLSDSTSGNTTLATEAAAWQAMAADRVLYGIVAANMSYSATPDPLDVSQQAIDSAALNADVVCCVAAANTGASTVVSCGATNALAVGAVSANTFAVAGFSSRGPLQGDPQRFYPDLAACGVSTVMALRDNETSNYTDSGTSMASPQVAGAATQLRARFPQLTALQARVVLLASTMDIATQNPGLTRNDYGVGFLRNDRAHEVVLNGQVGTLTVSTAAPVQFVTLPVQAGRRYQVAIAWNRLDTTSTAWSNLDVEVLDANQNVVAQSATPRNTYEMVRFQAPATGNLTLRITAVSVGGGPSQDVAFAFGEAAPTPVAGSIVSFGSACAPNVLGFNPAGGTLQPLQRAMEVAYQFQAPAPMQIQALEVFAQSTLNTSVVVSLYLPVAGNIAQAQTAVTAVALGPTPGFYRATFSSPPSVPAGPFWIAIDHRLQTSYLSHLTTGASTAAFERPVLFSGAWTAYAPGLRPAFRFFGAVGGVGRPTLTTSGSPLIGYGVSHALSGAPSGAAAFLCLGLSNTLAPFGALPYSLAGLGAPSCNLLTSGDSTTLWFANGSGTVSVPFSIPNDPYLPGTQIHAQYAVLHPPANSLGVLTSGATSTRIGN